MTGSGGGSLKYLAFIMDLSDVQLYCQHKSTSHDFNEAEFISKYVTGTTPYPASGINQFISVRLANETTHCAMHDTRFSLNFTAAGSTPSFSFMGYGWNKEASDAVSSQLLLAIADILNGAIGAAESGPVAQSGDSGTASLVSVRTRIMETALIGFVSTDYKGVWGRPLAELPDADRKLTKNKTLPATLEELSRNVTLSLLSSDRLWSPNVTLANVTQSEYRTIYKYRSRNLFLAYGIAIATSAMGVLLGLRALWINGVAHDTGYFSIMTTTRNRYLDDLTVGYNLGAVPVPKHIQKERLRFGRIVDAGYGSEGQEVRVGFGAEEQIEPIRVQSTGA